MIGNLKKTLFRMEKKATRRDLGGWKITREAPQTDSCGRIGSVRENQHEEMKRLLRKRRERTEG